ncbi:DUF3043 domain-containing protein [Sciscionella marina]|uniref:DUF3043 domain-containing protein n=1 Tax=Sciscionella marina TaxID=508770 RepID=UPI0003722EDB|nr:DUF3043 domain-containing protein [Sciscionella marina]
MKLFNRARDEQTADASTAEAAESIEDKDESAPRGYTAPKGRPTPSRKEASGGQRGPMLPPPTTQREAAKRAKKLRGSKEDRRTQAAERRKKMEAGDDRYVMPRDRGPVRRYVRDVVDSKRNFAGLFMPMAGLIFISLFTPTPQVQQIAVLVCTVILALMVIEGVINGRNITKRVRAKFPDATDKGLSLGWYAFVRSTQIRKLRMPKPRIKAGQKVD